MDIDEKAYWLAVLSASDIDRTLAKGALYRWTIAEQQPLSACADPAGMGLRACLPELSDDEAARWSAALAGIEAARAELERLRALGIDVITRADPLYPENLAERLAEPWLPYLFYYRGNLELLSAPAVYVSGAQTPSPEAAGLAEGLARRLVALPVTSLGGYTQGIERMVLTTASASSGPTVLMLPVGMDHAEPIRRAGQQAVAQGTRLELSPYAPATEYTAALGRARTLLTTALSDILVLVDPDVAAGDWPGLREHTAHGGRVLLWATSPTEIGASWQAADAIVVPNAADAERHIVLHLGLASDADTQTTEETEYLEEKDEAPVHFGDASSAIDLLQRTGRVPDSLARRLRDAERQGKLGDEEND